MNADSGLEQPFGPTIGSLARRLESPGHAPAWTAVQAVRAVAAGRVSESARSRSRGRVDRASSPIAFSVWDGGANERGNKRGLTNW